MSNLLSLKLNLEFKTTSCIACGTTIALPTQLYNQLLYSGNTFYCPIGHTQCFVQGQTKEDILEKKIEILKRGKEFAERQTNKALAAKRYHKNCARAQKAAKTRLKNRAKHGVCPCCNRTFKQLAAHMKSQHPEYMEPKK